MPTKIRTLDDLGIDPEAVEDALSRNLTFPARWYSDPDIYAFEVENVFARSWQYAGRLANLANPGDHIVCQVGQVPIVVTRDLEGQLHAFVNVCRHRAYPVAVENGNRKILQCGYHAWTYNLDGCLHKAPRSEREEFFDKSEFSLLPASVDTWNELVFVNPDPEAAPLLASYPEFEALAVERGLDFRGYRYHSRFTYEVPANWKVWVENASECYHCPTIHTHSFSDAFVDKPDIYEYVDGFRVLGQFTIYNPRAKKYVHPVSDGDREFRFLYLWPGTTLVQDDLVATAAVIVPTGPETCRFLADMFVRPEADETEVTDWLTMLDQTLTEDTHAVGLQQPGLRSQMVPHGRLMPASESAIARFHRIVWESFTEILDEG
jgi:phenylpropionate dioxygenase-like ring-hydroxylating dioxygenase large terminal subunit